MKSSRQLTREQITAIVIAVSQGQTQTSLAVEYHVDRSTISYHVKKAAGSFPEEPSFYAELRAKIQPVCSHPSMRCSVCGEMHDNAVGPTQDRIRKLEAQIAQYESILRVNGLMPQPQSEPFPWKTQVRMSS